MFHQEPGRSLRTLLSGLFFLFPRPCPGGSACKDTRVAFYRFLHRLRCAPRNELQAPFVFPTEEMEPYRAATWRPPPPSIESRLIPVSPRHLLEVFAADRTRGVEKLQRSHLHYSSLRREEKSETRRQGGRDVIKGSAGGGN